MPIGNLAKVFGPTVVGHSAPTIEPMDILQETKIQPKVRTTSRPTDTANNKLLSQSCAVAKSENSGGPLDNQTWQTEWKTALLAILQFCENKDQTLEAFVAASRLIDQWPA